MLRSAFSRKKSKKIPKLFFFTKIKKNQIKKKKKKKKKKYAYTLTHVIKGPPAKNLGV
jgi:hypothetical protein